MLVNNTGLTGLAQLYIGDLHSSVREGELYSIAHQYGDITFIKLIRSQTYTNRAYAFIAYKDPTQASSARRELNGSKIKNTVIRVCRVTKDHDPQSNIFVKNIPPQATLKNFEDIFTPYGAIISSKICYDTNGNSLGYGFIQFERKDKAQEAINKLNGFLWGTNKIIVSEFLPIASRSIANKTNLYIKGFPLSYSQDMIKEIFSQFGEITSIGLMTSKTKDGERAFGFVCFSNQDSASKACEIMHTKKEEDFEWYVVPHMNKNVRKAVLRDQYLKKIEEWKVKNLYIRNIPKSICDTKLREICLVYGQISSLKIVLSEHIKYNAEGDMHKELLPRGIGFVCFVLEKSATLALKELQEKTLEGQKLYVARWKPRNELKMGLITKMQMRNERALRFATGPIGFQIARGQGFPINMPYFPAMMPFDKTGYAVNQQGKFGNFSQVPPSSQIPNGNYRRPPVPMGKPGIPATVQEKKTTYEALLPFVMNMTSELVAGKVTNMLLDHGNQIAYSLMSNETLLKEKVREAIEQLKTVWANNPTQLKFLESIPN
ncbi:hypothetical protein SteCoe_11718 [Stentor coeruleus]|uniref:Polyadenylate-binding protein n=1 Tax=Stentor coeruleus TaxID=5963 RepID=A0A1R2CCH7_9CILI|nr:hypothetical protein SteCoe_11718 [Stentor coeruleus]